MNDLEYIKKKRVIEIMEYLLGYVYIEKPTNVVELLIDVLRKLDKKQNSISVFNVEDIKNVYDFLNLENNTYITKDKCIL
ncbi:conserved protein, unknown function, partial [Hepatocystis sp. ex Piliocolobus tephrosceles]